MKANSAIIRYHSTFEPCNAVPKHARYVSNITKNSSATFDKQQFLSYQEELRSNHTKRHSALYQTQPAHSNQLEKEFNTILQKIQSMMEKSEWLSRHQRIRINQWLVKLTCKQLNPVWKKNVNFYLEVMLEMMLNQKITEPFVSLPHDGPLPKLTIYDLPYPIRQKFTQSKEKTQKRSQNSKVSRQSKSILKQKRDNISRMQSYNGNCEISILQKNCSWFENNVDMNSSALYSLQNEPSFQSNQIELKMPIKPVFSNDKTRKQTLNRSNPNSNKNEGIKNKSKANTGNRCLEVRNVYEEDKENNPNIANIKRQLFTSKEKDYQLEINKKEQKLQTGNNNQRFGQNKRIKHPEIEPKYAQKVSIKQKFNVLPKVFQLLQQNQASLGSQPAYSEMLQQLSQLGKQLQINMCSSNQQDELNESTLSENSKAFIKASQEIRSKFRQTDNETLQFMSYLNRLKQKDKRI